MQPTSEGTFSEQGCFSGRFDPVGDQNVFGSAQRGYAHTGEFGQIIPAETRALCSWDEGRSFVGAWSRTFGEPASAVVPTRRQFRAARPVGGVLSEPKNRLDFCW